MKMIIAINNRKLADRLILGYSSKYNIYLIDSKELILRMLEKNEDYILIVRYDLKGDIDFLDFVTNIKKITKNIRIIVLVKELNQELKEQLFSKEIFNIIEGKNFLFEELMDNIDNPKMIVYKNKSIEYKKSNLIFVVGQNCSGKTTLAQILSKKIARDKSKKVLVIDMDFISPCLDLYVTGIKNFSLVDYIKDIMELKIKKIESYETTDEKYKNLKYILNYKSIGIPNEKVIISMIDNVKDKYDYIIIDTSCMMINQMYKIANIFGGNIIFVIEPNIKGIRSFDILTNLIDRNILVETKLVINKYKGNKKMYEYIKRNIPLKIYGKIKNTFNIENYYERNKVDKIKCNLNEFLKSVGIIKYVKWKNRLIEKILNFEEE